MAAGVRRLIFLSTVKVYGESTRPGEAFKETDALNPQDDYGESKKQAEEVLRAFRQRGLEVCCLRLPLIYGPRAKANLCGCSAWLFLACRFPWRVYEIAAACWV